MQLLVLISALVAFTSQVALASLPVDATQLANWQQFFDATGGLTWTKCKGKRDSPCTCSGTVDATVTCTNNAGTNVIKSIVLKNNNLAAATYPSDLINNIIGANPAFTVFDVRGNPKLLNPGATCVTVPNCAGKTCRLGFPLCTETLPPVVSSSPTPRGTKSPTIDGKPAWSDFFAATGGASWTKCSRSASEPCLCQVNQPTSAPIRVVCTGTTITKISLINNNLAGDAFPAQDVNDLILAGATTINLTNNPALAPAADCFDVPACGNAGVTCSFDKPLCNGQTTVSPTSEVTGTSSPVTGSVAPTTVAPTTVPPTTAAPTTAAPTTAAPTTKAPTSPPGVIPPPVGTPAPTSAGTNVPTVIPTSRPTNGTAPTPTPAPSSVGTQTPAPSGSMASVINGFFVSFVVTVMAVMMM